MRVVQGGQAGTRAPLQHVRCVRRPLRPPLRKSDPLCCSYSYNHIDMLTSFLTWQVWVGNCIGALNVRYFLQTLLYGFLTAGLSAFICARFLLHAAAYRRKRGRRDAQLALTTELFAAFVVPLATLVVLVLTAALAALLEWQLRLALRDQTSLEQVRVTAGRAVRSYDKGARRNLVTVLGHPARWLIPVPPLRRSTQ